MKPRRRSPRAAGSAATDEPEAAQESLPPTRRRLAPTRRTRASSPLPSPDVKTSTESENESVEGPQEHQETETSPSPPTDPVRRTGRRSLLADDDKDQAASDVESEQGSESQESPVDNDDEKKQGAFDIESTEQGSESQASPLVNSNDDKKPAAVETTETQAANSEPKAPPDPEVPSEAAQSKAVQDALVPEALANGGGELGNGEPGVLPANKRPASARIRDHEHRHKTRRTTTELDEGTLTAVKTYLKDNIQGDSILDENEIALFILKMDRLATEQTRYQQRLTGDSDDEDDSLYGEILAEEEEHALAQSFFRSVVNKVKKIDDDVQLDKGTLDWIRRATGLQKNNLAVHARQGSTLTQEPGMAAPMRRSARRYTRGMARSSRTQKRQKDLSFLMGAIGEMEEEFGKYERKRPPKRPARPVRRPRSLSPYQADDEEPARRKHKRKKNELVARYPKKARRGINDTASSGDVYITKLLVNGVHVSQQSNNWDLFKAELKRERSLEYQQMKRRGFGREYKAARKQELDSIHYIRAPAKAPPSLALLNWQRKKSAPDPKKETREAYETRIKRVIPSTYSEAGIIHCPRSWASLNPSLSPISFRNPFDAPRVRHTDEVYAANCHKLIAAVQGKSRSWAVSEFFYSDLDRPWFNRSKFVEDVAKLGVHPGMMLTRREWTAVRRRIPNKPRLFSKRFIASQLSERNRYRNTVRMLQRNVELYPSLQFPYDVPAPIKVGTLVTAFNRRYRVIHRGVVLSYDRPHGRYLVQFERKEFGHDFCPDSEVAAHGIPQLLMRAPEKTLGAATEGFLGSQSNGQGGLSCTSSYGPVPGVKPKRDVVISEGFGKLFPFRALAFDGSHQAQRRIGEPSNEHQSDIEKGAERETLVSLLSSIEAGSARKRMLLDTIEKFNALMVQRLPFGDDDSTTSALPPQAEQHFSWLVANLEVTNRFLERALASFRLMYGDACLPPADDSETHQDFMESAIGEILEKRKDLPPMALPWIVQLAVGAEDLGQTVVSSLAQKKRSEKKRGEAQPLDNERTRFMQTRLASVSELLLSASYGNENSKGEAAANHLVTATALTPGAKKLLSSDHLPTHSSESDLLVEMLASRDLAVADLKESMDLLNAELAASSMKRETAAP